MSLAWLEWLSCCLADVSLEQSDASFFPKRPAGMKTQGEEEEEEEELF